MASREVELEIGYRDLEAVKAARRVIWSIFSSILTAVSLAVGSNRVPQNVILANILLLYIFVIVLAHLRGMEHGIKSRIRNIDGENHSLLEESTDKNSQ